MGNPLISIITPVYNVEPYLRRCLDSILNQSNIDWEALLIDDGSTDKSGEICDEYATRDNRFKVFHQANSGVSSARNIGLDHAKGDWIAFVDADDEITSDYLLMPQNNQDYDVIVKGFIEKAVDCSREFPVHAFIFDSAKTISKWYLRDRNNALWDKLIKRNIIKDVRFNASLKIGEDLVFFVSLLNSAFKITSDKNGRYLYYQRSNSAMSLKVKDEMNIDRYLYICELILESTTHSRFKDLGESLLAQLYIPLIGIELKNHSKQQKKKFWNICNKVHFKNLSYLTNREIFRYYYTMFRMFVV